MAEPVETPLPPLVLTGGIASGKSTVAELFRSHGAMVLSADLVGRQLLEPGALGWLKLRDSFAERFFDASGRLDRAALRQAIFKDAGLRARVDGLLHPLIRTRLAELVAASTLTARPVPTRSPAFSGTVVEVPLLFEAGWQDDFGCVLVVSSDEEQAVRRLMTRDRVSRSEAEAALAVQLPLAEKLARADLVIDNRGELAATALQVAEIIEKLSAGAGCGQRGRVNP